MKKFWLFLMTILFLVIVPLGINIDLQKEEITETDREIFVFYQASAGDESAGDASAQTPPVKKSFVEESLTRLVGGFDSIFIPITKGVAWVILSFLGLLLHIAGTLLNLSSHITVYEMSKFVKVETINDIWIIFRNIIAISFIFAILYLAIKTILGLMDSNGKKLLKNIIISALLINFSYFFVTVAIDLSNVLSLQIYSYTNRCGEQVKSIGSNSSHKKAAEIGIANCIMQNLGLSSLFTWGNSEKAQSLLLNDGDTSVAVFGKALFSSILILFAIFIVLFMALILILRLVYLLVLLITSPIMFLGMVWPGLKEVSSAWWKKFSEQIFLAPVMFLMFYIAILILKAVNKSLNVGTAVNLSSVTAPSGYSTVVVLIFYIIAIIMFGMVIFVSKKVAGSTAGLAMQGAGVLGAGGLALGGRKAVGFGKVAANSWLGKKIGVDTESLQNKTKSDNFLVRSYAKTALKTGNNLQNRTFDWRNAWGVSKALSAAGISAGNGTTKTFEKTVKAKQEKLTKKAKLYGQEKKSADDKEFAEDGEKFNEELAKDTTQQSKYKEAKQNAEKSEEEIKKTQDEIAVLVQQKREAMAKGELDVANTIQGSITMLESDLKTHQENLNYHKKIMSDIKTLIQKSLSEKSSKYLTQKSKQWWTPTTKMAAVGAIKNKEKDMDKVLKAVKEELDKESKKGNKKKK